VKEYDKTLLRAHGDDVFISGNVEIRRPHLVSMGSHIAIDSGFYLTTQAELGDFIHIGPSVLVIGGEKARLKMGHFTNLALGTRVVCGSDTYGSAGLITAPGIPSEMTEVRHTTVTLQDFVNVGGDAFIFPGVTLGEGSVIAARSLVTKDTDPWTIYMGSPARPAGQRAKEKILAHARKLGYRAA
jgi:acetyltransferase-like isoleucine patch superfamily enzyme